MEFNPIVSVSRKFLLHPRDEQRVLASKDKRIQELKEEWLQYNRERLNRSYLPENVISNLHIPISFSAFILHKRIQAYVNTKSIDKIFTRINITESSHEGARLVRYGFIIYGNKGMIYPSQETTLYGIPLNDAIQIQDNLLYELIDLEVYKCRDLYDFFYHNLEKLYISSGCETIFDEDNWRNGTEVLSIKNIESNVFKEIIERRPYIFLDIYPGNLLIDNTEGVMQSVYASSKMRLIDTRKLPSGWIDVIRNIISDTEDPVYQHGIYPVTDICISLTYQGRSLCDTPRRFWNNPETLFTLCKSDKRCIGDIDVVCL